MRTLLIGDVHGCARELDRLLAMIAPAASDRLVFLGDLVNKGPDPAGVFRQVRDLGALSLRGNHENDHLRWRDGRGKPRADSVATRAVMPADLYGEFLAFAAAMPLFYEDPACIAVHGAVRPGLPLTAQPADLLTGDVTPDPSWIETIHLDRPLVVGHKRYRADMAEPFIRPGIVYGLDTGCVYGGALTALALPGGEIFQVPAARPYAEDPA